ETMRRFRSGTEPLERPFPALLPKLSRQAVTTRGDLMKFATSVCITALLAASGLACAAPLSEANPEDAGVSSQRLELLTTALQRLVDSGELAGMVVMVARRGKLVYHKSFGLQDKAKSVPMSMDSIFRVYSMTKPVVSVAAMILVEEGKLS